MPVRISSVWWLAGALLPYAFVATQSSPPAQQPSFERDAMGVFKAYCLTCHSGAGAPAGLDLSTPEGIRKGGVSGPLFISGKPDQSLLIHRLLGLDGKPQMPKGFASIGAEKIEGLKRWIAAGGSTKASADSHWAYSAPKRASLPTVKNGSWAANPIDRFVLARLEKEGLTPSPAASKETLLRRVSLDLTGLPPTTEEIDAFLNDRDPKAYERVVDRLLASPHYGERQARIWLDLARYADTHGYEADRSRVAYKYRDWVINAFNTNMPYSEFGIEQIAGDLFPNATLDQRIATGFERNSMFNEEGGVDPAESMFETMIDRVSTTSTVFMGSTLGCARCHDHKFDPFTQKDFYKMVAFFSNNRYDVAGDYNTGQRKWYEPNLSVPSPEQSKAQAALKEQIYALGEKAKRNPQDVNGFIAEAKSVAWIPLGGEAFESATKAGFKRLDDGSYLLTSPVADRDTYTVTGTLPEGTWTGLRVEVMPDPSLPLKGPGRATSGNFLLTKVAVNVDGKAIEWNSDVSFTQNGYDLTGLKEGVNEAGGWAVYPQAGKPHEMVIGFKSPVAGGKVSLTLEMQSKTWPQHVIGRFRVQATKAPNPTRFALTEAAKTAVAAETPNKDQLAALAKYLEKFDPVRKQLASAKAKLDELNGQIPTALVLSEKPAKGPLTYPIHRRGEFLQPTEPVEAGTPGFLPSPVGGNRLSLAKWLFSKEHPLTARVQVNRMWASYFGRGLVETEEDFGTQGAPPTHPELLDWLACELRDSGWNLKHVHKLIVMSATYRQASADTPKLLVKDPQNVLLARGPRFRMEAEMIRDTALTAAGLLNGKVGGPSVMPYQPDNIWDSPYSGEAWRNAMGPERYRRGLYVYWKRTAPYPSFMAFDSTSRESCTVRRVRTNTPLQALALLNDKAYIECAAALASRFALKKTEAERIAAAFRACTGRKPTPDETGRLSKLLASLRAKYTKAPQEAKKLLTSISPPPNPLPTTRDIRGEGEKAAWIMVCNVLLNLDETITKG